MDYYHNATLMASSAKQYGTVGILTDCLGGYRTGAPVRKLRVGTW